MPFPKRGLSRLRKNRIAVSGARYFVTAVTDKRKQGLDYYPIWAKFLELICRNPADIIALVAMPDHLHLLFVLPADSTPGCMVRSIKGPMTPVLRREKLSWQENYFEHRLRPEEESEPYLRYMLANPYRANLVKIDEPWPFWAITSPSATWFLEKYPKQRPEPEWLRIGRPWEDQAP